jgi:YaiO family outer membrane protein
MMREVRHKSIIIVLVVLMITGGGLSSQTIQNPEEEYARIRSMAFSGKFADAETSAWNLVKQYPEYGDARVLLGRIIAWQGNYDEAASVIDTLLLNDPGNEDAAEALRDIRRWSRDRSQQNTPSTDIRAGYFLDTYSQPHDRLWQVFSLGAGHRFSWGSAVATAGLGHVILGAPADVSDNDLQFGIEAWPDITRNNYAYVAYAFSPGPWFPKHRAALELWQTLPAGFAVSAGMNYYYFDRNLFIGTFSLEKYLGDYWFSVRGYFPFKDIGVTPSVYLTIRCYMGTTDYLQLTAGTGSAPDEPFDVMTAIERQYATSVRLSYFNQINSYWSFRVGAGYSYEKYAEEGYRNRFEGNLTLIRGIGRVK